MDKVLDYIYWQKQLIFRKMGPGPLRAFVWCLHIAVALPITEAYILWNIRRTYVTPQEGTPGLIQAYIADARFGIPEELKAGWEFTLRG